MMAGRDDLAIGEDGHDSEGLERASVVAEYERHGHRLRFSASA